MLRQNKNNSVIRKNNIIDVNRMSSYKFIVLFKEKFKLTDVLVSADGKWLSVAHNEKSVSCCYQSQSLYMK